MSSHIAIWTTSSLGLQYSRHLQDTPLLTQLQFSTEICQALSQLGLSSHLRCQMLEGEAFHSPPHADIAVSQGQPPEALLWDF